MRIACFAAVIIAALASPDGARAQFLPGGPGQMVPPGGFTIAGIPVACGPAPTMISPAINDIARGGPMPPLIMLHPVFFQQPPPLQLFIYAHECAHVNGIMNESAADCWAVRLGRAQGWFDQQSLGLLFQSFAGNPGDWTHLPGPARVQVMAGCFMN